NALGAAPQLAPKFGVGDDKEAWKFAPGTNRTVDRAVWQLVYDARQHIKKAVEFFDQANKTNGNNKLQTELMKKGNAEISAAKPLIKSAEDLFGRSQATGYGGIYWVFTSQGEYQKVTGWQGSFSGTGAVTFTSANDVVSVFASPANYNSPGLRAHERMHMTI